MCLKLVCMLVVQFFQIWWQIPSQSSCGSMQSLVSARPELAAVKLADVQPLCDKPAPPQVLTTVTSMFNKLALDKAGLHHVITYLIRFEKFQLPLGEWELHPSDDGSDIVVFGVQDGAEDGSEC